MVDSHIAFSLCASMFDQFDLSNNWQWRKRLTATECLRHSWLQIKPLPKETPKTVQTTAEEVSQLLSTKEVGELLPSKEVGEVPPAKEVDEPLPASESNQPLEKPPEKAPPIPTNSTPSAAEPDSVVPPLSYVAEIPVPVAEPTQPYTKPIHKDQTRIKVYPVDHFILNFVFWFLIFDILSISGGYSLSNSFNLLLICSTELNFLQNPASTLFNMAKCDALNIIKRTKPIEYY